MPQEQTSEASEGKPRPPRIRTDSEAYRDDEANRQSLLERVDAGDQLKEGALAAPRSRLRTDTQLHRDDEALHQALLERMEVVSKVQEEEGGTVRRLKSTKSNWDTKTGEDAPIEEEVLESAVPIVPDTLLKTDAQLQQLDEERKKDFLQRTTTAILHESQIDAELEMGVGSARVSSARASGTGNARVSGTGSAKLSGSMRVSTSRVHKTNSALFREDELSHKAFVEHMNVLHSSEIISSTTPAQTPAATPTASQITRPLSLTSPTSAQAHSPLASLSGVQLPSLTSPTSAQMRSPATSPRGTPSLVRTGSPTSSLSPRSPGTGQHPKTLFGKRSRAESRAEGNRSAALPESSQVRTPVQNGTLETHPEERYPSQETQTSTTQTSTASSSAPAIRKSVDADDMLFGRDVVAKNKSSLWPCCERPGHRRTFDQPESEIETLMRDWSRQCDMWAEEACSI